MTKKSVLITLGRWILILIISVSVIVSAIYFQDKLSEFRSLGLLGIFLANLVGSATIFLPAPAIVTVVAGGFVYPPVLVAIVATLGATLGDMVGFLLGYSSKKVLIHKEHELYAKFAGLIKKYGGLLIVIFAFLPNPVFDAVGIAAGALGYPVAKFFFWTALGRLARNILLAFFGKQIDLFQ